MQYLGFEKCIEKVRTPKKIPKKEYQSTGAVPIIAQEKELVNGYTDKLEGVFKVDSAVLVFGDHTCALKYVDFDFVLGADGAKIIQPKSNIDPKFFFYLLTAFMPKSTGYARHYRFLKDLVLPIPTLSEQVRIVAKLDAAFAEIDRSKSAILDSNQQTASLFEKLLDQMITEPTDDMILTELDNVARFLDYRGKTPNKSAEGIRLLTAKNVRMGFLKKEPEEFVDAKEYERHMVRGFPQVGNVVFTTEAPLGMVAQIEDASVALGQRLITFQVKEKMIENGFLKYLLMSPFYQKKIHEQGTGATVTGIKASLLKKIEIGFPKSKIEQSARLDKMVKVDELCNKIVALNQKKMAAYDKLKSAILSQELRSEAA